MPKNSQRILRSLPPDQKAEIKEMQRVVEEVDFGSIFDAIDLGVIGRKLITFAIDIAQSELLPKIEAVSPKLALIIAMLLEAAEGALKQTE